MRVLSINCGSSSLKYAVFDVEAEGPGPGRAPQAESTIGPVARPSPADLRGGAERELARGRTDRIGGENGDHASAVHALIDELDRRQLGVDAVGHRVVHGGSEYSAPAIVGPPLLAALEALVPFAPLHLPAEIQAIRALAGRWPGCLQVACFDTAFHRTLSEVAQRYAIEDDLYASGVKRYGFHGLSYEYVVSSVGAQNLGRAVIAHLGNGSSLAAVCDGRSVDTTMGFTPSGGLVMGTRAGDVDPGLLIHLVERGSDARALDAAVNRRGGLLGLSGTTSDVRDLLERRALDPRARLALDVFAWSARKWIGAMAAVLGGLDSLVFTGGIGENAPAVRADIAEGLAHLGVHLDPARNARGEEIVSPDGARCTVRVVRTDEERMVARHAARLASNGPAHAPASIAVPF